MRRTVMGVLAVLGLSAGAAQGQYLMVPESQTDTIWLFDPQNGSLVTQQWADMSFLGLPGDVLPLQAIQVGREIWVTDQAADTIAIFRVSKNTPELLTTISGATTGGLDNIRGIAYTDGVVFVANAGTGNGAPGTAILRIDPATRTVLGNFAVPSSPWGVLPYNGELLIALSGSSGGNRIVRYSTSGTYLGDFVPVTTSGIRFPYQLAVKDNGNILAAGFSPPNLLWEYSPTGEQIRSFTNSGGNRGIFPLRDGNVLYTNGTGILIHNETTGASSYAFGSGAESWSFRFISPLCLADYDGSGFVDSDDFTDFVGNFTLGCTAPANPDPACTWSADIDGSGFVDSDDFVTFVDAFTVGC
ncbi:MAG: hypothetical protein SFY95_11495 [Planctomycetota bacterium]|nr:hypothetical protein [Planctomycetota bacterium]